VRAAARTLLAPVPDNFADAINSLAAQNLARAWTIDVAS
jgi:hypothetical protein